MTFYGNVRLKIVNGFSFEIQEQPWKLDKNGYPLIQENLIHKITPDTLNSKLLITSGLKPYEVPPNGVDPNINTGMVGIIEPYGTLKNTIQYGTIPQIGLQHNIYNNYSLEGEKIGGYSFFGVITRPREEFTIVKEDINIISDFYKKNEDDSFYTQLYSIEQQDPSTLTTIKIPLSFSLLKFDNNSFIDQQGHIGTIPKDLFNETYNSYLLSSDSSVQKDKNYYKYEFNSDQYVIIKKTELNYLNSNPSSLNWFEPNPVIIPTIKKMTAIENQFEGNYIHNNWVEKIVGPYDATTGTTIKTKNNYLKSLNTTLKKGYGEIPQTDIDGNYITEIGNCADLHTIVGTFYDLLGLNEDNLINFNEVIDNIKKETRDLKELINTDTIKVLHPFGPSGATISFTSLYEYNFGHAFLGLSNNYIEAQDEFAEMESIPMNIDQNNYIKIYGEKPWKLLEIFNSINYSKDLNGHYVCNYNKGSIFIKQIDDLRQARFNSEFLKNTVLKEKICRLKDFFDLMNIFFYSQINTNSNLNAYENWKFQIEQEAIFNSIKNQTEYENLWEDTTPLFIKWANRMRKDFNIARRDE